MVVRAADRKRCAVAHQLHCRQTAIGRHVTELRDLRACALNFHPDVIAACRAGHRDITQIGQRTFVLNVHADIVGAAYIDRRVVIGNTAVVQVNPDIVIARQISAVAFDIHVTQPGNIIPFDAALAGGGADIHA